MLCESCVREFVLSSKAMHTSSKSLTSSNIVQIVAIQFTSCAARPETHVVITACVHDQLLAEGSCCLFACTRTEFNLCGVVQLFTSVAYHVAVFRTSSKNTVVKHMNFPCTLAHNAACALAPLLMYAADTHGRTVIIPTNTPGVR